MVGVKEGVLVKEGVIQEVGVQEGVINADAVRVWEIV